MIVVFSGSGSIDRGVGHALLQRRIFPNSISHRNSQAAKTRIFDYHHFLKSNDKVNYQLTSEISYAQISKHVSELRLNQTGSNLVPKFLIIDFKTKLLQTYRFAIMCPKLKQQLLSEYLKYDFILSIKFCFHIYLPNVIVKQKYYLNKKCKQRKPTRRRMDSKYQ